MLNEILAYAERTGLQSEPGFTVKTAKWAVFINEQAEIGGITPLGDGKNGLTFNHCPDLSQGEMIAGGVTRSQFLIESLAVVALFYKADIKETELKKFQIKREYFIKQLELASEDCPELACVAAALKDPEQLETLQSLIENQQPKPKSTDSVTFLINESYPLKSIAWHNWWREQRQPVNAINDKKKSVSTMRCLFTGAAIEPVETHPKIKGLSSVGGLGTGDVLMAFDKEAFQSYGLSKSTNAATDEITAKSYAETFNKLISDQSIRLVNGLAVYWFGHNLNDDDDMFAELENPSEPLAGQATRPKQLLAAINTGQRPDLLGNYYYVVTVSGQAGRVMVRDWQQGALTELLINISAWFDDLQIIARDGGKLTAPPKFLAVVGCLVRDLKDAPAPLINELWRTALNQKKPIPYSAFTQALLESRKAIINEEAQNHARMGLIKAYHIRNKGDQHMNIHLNQEHPNPAYQCGRLLAVLADLQYAALGDVGAGVVQRYYTATSQTPALRIGQLMSNAKNHLTKVGGGLAFEFENRLSEIMSRMTAIPKILDLEDQSLFALGYYQQLAQIRAKMAENKANKQAKQTNKEINP
ncbi:MAG: type I-C CRISPR-associated protein Cas8c/Csd1 [Methylobacter sp.]|nr:type I-C CRISPR-associated protein Cas8c/Csd1 [Methylobacter sp.]